LFIAFMASDPLFLGCVPIAAGNALLRTICGHGSILNPTMV
jgi:hypothetical protein